MTRRVLHPTLVGLLVAALVAGLTYALWGQHGTVGRGVVTTGDLDIELVGQAAWQETSADVAQPRSGSVLDDGTVDHLATPGDTLVVTQEFRARLEGDNVAARVTVSWSEEPVVPDGVTATYVVTTPDGRTGAVTPLGSPVVVPSAPDHLTPDVLAGWGDGPWRLVVTVSLSGDVVVRAPGGSGAAGPGGDAAVTLGSVELELDQVRAGEGFTP